MEQWRYAEKALAEQKARELAGLSEERAREMSYELLSMARLHDPDPARVSSSGLVEQQKWFSRWKG